MHMNVLQAIAERRSIRRFDPNYELSDAEISLILESARMSPSGSNTQPWRFIVVRDKQRIGALVACSYNQLYFQDASCMLVAVADCFAKRALRERLLELAELKRFTPEEAEEFSKAIRANPQRDPFTARRDTAIAVYGMMLQATDIGVGSCWVAIRNGLESEVKDICNIPHDPFDPGAGDGKKGERYMVLGLLALGKPADGEWPTPTPRMCLTDFVYSEQWLAPLPETVAAPG